MKRSVLAGLTIAGSVLQGLGELIKGFNGTDEVKDVSEPREIINTLFFLKL